jgi:hypothetical protein
VSTDVTRDVPCKLLDFFLVSAIKSGFCQVSVSWSDHDVMCLLVRLEWSRGIEVFRSVRIFRDFNLGELFDGCCNVGLVVCSACTWC